MRTAFIKRKHSSKLMSSMFMLAMIFLVATRGEQERENPHVECAMECSLQVEQQQNDSGTYLHVYVHALLSPFLSLTLY